MPKAKISSRQRRGETKLPDGNLLPELRFRDPSWGSIGRFNALVKALPKPFYKTPRGRAYHADSLELLRGMPDSSVDLIVTSPPYALLSKKSYGNEDALQYAAWFQPFAAEFHRVLKKRGSLVLEFGGTWERGKPVRSLYQFALLLELAKTFRLAQEFYWYNSAKLPTPAEWVTVRRCRLKDAVTNVFWLSKSDTPKADNKRVLYPYGEAMERLLRNGYNHGLRPSEHRISKVWGKRNRGAIAPNILICPNTLSSDPYQKRCRALGLQAHPARFPPALPRFFIRFLTEIGDVVVDPFAGSNTTGREAEDNNRFWIGIEKDTSYIEASSLRFFEKVVKPRATSIRKPSRSAATRPSAA